VFLIVWIWFYGRSRSECLYDRSQCESMFRGDQWVSKESLRKDVGSDVLVDSW